MDLIEEAIRKDSDARKERKQGEAVRVKFNSLTPREQQVMKLVARGRSNKQMADQLEITTKTIEAHRAKVMEKMAVRSVAELTQLAACSLPRIVCD